MPPPPRPPTKTRTIWSDISTIVDEEFNERVDVPPAIYLLIIRKQITLAESFVLSILYEFTSNRRDCYMTTGYLAARTGLSISGVEKTIRSLEKKKLVRRECKSRRKLTLSQSLIETAQVDKESRRHRFTMAAAEHFPANSKGPTDNRVPANSKGAPRQ